MATLPIGPRPPTPAQLLEGIALPSGWVLVERLKRAPGSSGSNFGTGYKAQRTVGGKTEHAFVKAMDLARAFGASDPFAEMFKLTAESEFERRALEHCRRLSRLIQLISWEYINQDPAGNPLNQVLCLIMEIGEGDIRKQLTRTGALPTSAILHVLEDTALGMAQLHRSGIAHQDVKPSNVISMTDMSNAAKNLFKVADLGRIVRKGMAGPYDTYPWPGDGNYQPPERWYGFVPPQWPDAREASDAYMLGSLACFLFCGVPMQPLLVREIPAAMLPGTWAGGYNDSLIQVLRSKQSGILAKTIAPTINERVRDGVIAIIKELVEPDPLKRGDKRARAQTGAPGLDRFQPRFKQLRLHAAIDEKIKSP
ncbi:protein kinase domain-containing protein [Aquincola tertiaricarbonis]|uniref:protein kinase domain-containing protein n=1 Tax=Aquincola tertiaricarbonis TaxID=391953 RepID=UPI0009FA4073|nr:protein kinase [Aquincola tertiaricarbonis]